MIDNNIPNKAARFLLVKLMEECAEVIKACSKVLEHGYIAQNEETGIQYNNAEDLAGELGHVLAAMHILCETVPVNIRTMALNHHNIESFALMKRNTFRDLAAKRRGS